MNNIGFRAHDLGKFTNSFELSREIVAKNCPRYIQLAPTKVFNNVNNICDKAIEWAIKEGQALEKENIHVSVLGCYVNPLVMEENKRKKVIDNFITSLKFSPYFGNAIVATETGTDKNAMQLNLDEKTRLNNFYNFLEKILPIAQKENAIVAIESVSDHTINSFEKIDNMLARFSCSNLKLIYDPVNFLPSVNTPIEKEKQKQLFSAFFDKYSSLIKAIHLKDFIIEDTVKNGNLPLFTGHLNIEGFIEELKLSKVETTLLLENADIPNIVKTTDKLIEYLK